MADTPIPPGEADRILRELGLFDLLAPFDVRFAGSIPLDVHGPGADADLICHAEDPAAFARLLEGRFGSTPGFSCRHRVIRGAETVIARFTHAGLPIEIFARAQPVESQEAVRHYRTEAALLARHGEALRRRVRALKAHGHATEPAFALALGLDGDPYRRLLDLAPAPTASAPAPSRRGRGYRAAAGAWR